MRKRKKPAKPPLLFFACEKDLEFLKAKQIVRESHDAGFSVEPILPSSAGFDVAAVTCAGMEDVEGTALNKVRRALKKAEGLFVFDGSVACEYCKPLFKAIDVHSRDNNLLLIFIRCSSETRAIDGRKRAFRYVVEGKPLFELNGQNLRRALVDVKTMVKGCLEEIQDERYERPQVGVGVFLVKRDRILLTRKANSPGVGKIATIGGRLPLRSKLVKAVCDIARGDLGIRKDEFSLGPLLSCTNMLVEERHWLDLTFLGVAKPRCEPQITEPALGSRRNYVSKTNELWFTVGETEEHFLKGELFEPIANAFEAFCYLHALWRSSFAVNARFKPGSSWMSAMFDKASPFGDSFRVTDLMATLENIQPREAEIFPHVFDQLHKGRQVK